MLLSLVGESSRARHVGVRLGFAFARVPRIATTLRKLSRYKYGVPAKQSKLGNAPDFVETLCGIDFLCHLDSSEELHPAPTLEDRVRVAIDTPEAVVRYGVVCLGLSDDAADVEWVGDPAGEWRRLVPHDRGSLELPVWVDHVGAKNTRWHRFALLDPAPLSQPETTDFVAIRDPR